MLVSLVTADSYQASPLPGLDNTFSDFRGSEVMQVPIIRVFGSTIDAKKTCLHIHGAFPYMYVPCTFDGKVDSFAYQLATALDTAINISLGLANCPKQHVYKVQCVSGIPFYGYHKRHQTFFKIFFYNPAMIKKAADLLQNGGVFNRSLQPYEAHIPFILQFMIDYNLYGMNFIHIDNIKCQRYTQLIVKDSVEDGHSFQMQNLQENIIAPLMKQTTCQLELDVCVSDIINSRDISNGLELNPGLAAIWNDEKFRRTCAGLDQPKSQLLYSQTSDRIAFCPTISDQYQKQRFIQRLQAGSENTNSELSEENNTLSDPSKITNNDYMSTASCVLNHNDMSMGSDKPKKNVIHIKSGDLDAVPINETSKLHVHEKTITTSFDSDDRSLAEILEHLAEDNTDINNIIDNDSVFGTQCLPYDDDIETDKEIIETENLNITTSVLMNSWKSDDELTDRRNSFSNGTQTDLHNTDLRMKKNTDILSIRQCDVADDILLTNHKSLIQMPACALRLARYPLLYLICVSETKEILQLDGRMSVMHFSNMLLKINKLSYTNIDIYGEFKTEIKNTCRKSIKVKNVLECKSTVVHNKEINVYCKAQETPEKSNKHISSLVIPAFDGCTVNSDSESEISVKKDEEENRCSSHQRTVEQTMSEKDRYNCDETKSLVSGKRKNYDLKGCKEQKNKKFEVSQDPETENLISTWKDDRSIDNRHQQNVKCTQWNIEKGYENYMDCVGGFTLPLREKVPFKIVTKFKPPNYDKVSETLKNYNIPECRYKKPFLCKNKDITAYKKMIENVCILNVSFSKSNLQCITSINIWRKTKVNEFFVSDMNMKLGQMKQALASYQTIKIKPLIQPPLLTDCSIQLQTKKLMLIENVHKQTGENYPNETYVDNASVESGNCNNPSRKTTDFWKLPTNTENNTISQMTPDGSLLHKSSESLRPIGISYGQIDMFPKHVSNCIAGDILCDKVQSAHHYLTIISLEIHVTTREDLLPDPQIDAIQGIFYAVEDIVSVLSTVKKRKHGAIVVNNGIQNSKIETLFSSITSCPVLCVKDEENLFKELVALVKKCDADILTGWEVETLSWGYIIQRAYYLKHNNFPMSLSRLVDYGSSKRCDYNPFKNCSNINIPGRIILDAWRIMKHELTLLSYTFENVLFNAMHERISCPSFKVLTNWWLHSNITMRCRLIDHYIARVQGTLRIMTHLDIISRSSEHAKLFGILLYEVFSRGSQFRVESMMLRFAKPLNYIAISPSVQQRANMRAPGALPLIMEPQSMLYTDPLIVLDFQSLYPSIIMAYNYCFSTCLGRVEYIGQADPFEFGTATLRVTKNTALRLQDEISFSPCGIAFVKPNVRRGILPRMLEQILNTRLMVKESIKVHSDENHSLQRALHSQQLGLKLIANVTYGYTAANFSGRMPCVELGDSIVSKGRETLERAIKIVESTEKWGARVVYGDTDSLFVLLPGKSRKEAFAVGAEIAEVVTAANPVPVKLKFEKILHPCILQTKKRYCGYMYESPNQEKAEYMAKGIETVRRDGCPAVSKILEKTLRILFDSKDIALVKSYVTRQLDKVIRKRISIQDLTFAKEFRGISGYKTNASVPALEITRRLMKKDPRAIPRQGQRVPYIVIAGAPDQPLIHCVRTPCEVISNQCLTPNSVYYITKVIIPPLNRCLNLIGIDVNEWYRDMTHHSVFDIGPVCASSNNRKIAIYQFFNNVTCIVCAVQTTKSICSNCLIQSSRAMVILEEKIRRLESSYHKITSVCLSCTGNAIDDFECASFDCPTLYRVKEAQRYLAEILDVKNVISIINDYIKPA